MFIIIETKQGTSYQLECPIDLDATTSLMCS